MTNQYVFDNKKRVIFVTKEFMNNAVMLNTEEYKLTRQWREMFPSYVVKMRTSKSTASRGSKLTIAFMTRYINTRIDASAVMTEFEEVHALYGFLKVQIWFAEKYPNYSDMKAFGEYITQNPVAAKPVVVARAS